MNCRPVAIYASCPLSEFQESVNVVVAACPLSLTRDPSRHSVFIFCLPFASRDLTLPNPSHHIPRNSSCRFRIQQTTRPVVTHTTVSAPAVSSYGHNVSPVNLLGASWKPDQSPTVHQAVIDSSFIPIPLHSRLTMRSITHIRRRVTRACRSSSAKNRAMGFSSPKIPLLPSS